MADKMTRYQVMKAVMEQDFDKLITEEAIECARKYIASADKQAAKPKEKTVARRQNEAIMRELLPIIHEFGKAFTATWAADKMSNDRYGLLTAQKMSKGALAVGEEWQQIKRVRTGTKTWFLLTEWDESKIEE